MVLIWWAEQELIEKALEIEITLDFRLRNSNSANLKFQQARCHSLDFRFRARSARNAQVHFRFREVPETLNCTYDFGREAPETLNSTYDFGREAPETLDFAYDFGHKVRTYLIVQPDFLWKHTKPCDNSNAFPGKLSRLNVPPTQTKCEHI